MALPSGTWLRFAENDGTMALTSPALRRPQDDTAAASNPRARNPFSARPAFICSRPPRYGLFDEAKTRGLYGIAVRAVNARAATLRASGGRASPCRAASSSPLEVLDRALVPLGRGEAAERAEVPAAAGPRIALARIEPVLPRLQLADHAQAPFKARRRDGRT